MTTARACGANVRGKGVHVYVGGAARSWRFKKKKLNRIFYFFAITEPLTRQLLWLLAATAVVNVLYLGWDVAPGDNGDVVYHRSGRVPSFVCKSVAPSTGSEADIHGALPVS